MVHKKHRPHLQVMPPIAAGTGKPTTPKTSKTKLQSKKRRHRHIAYYGQSIADRAQSYNIYNNMQCPSLLSNPSKVSASATVDAISSNMDEFALAYPFSGVDWDSEYGQVDESTGFYMGRDKALGANYFHNTHTLCDDSSKDGCAGRERYIYVRNIPTGKIPLLGDVSFEGVTGCNITGLTEGRGLIPGMLEDLSDIAPMALAIYANGGGNVGSSTCKKVSYPVGMHIYDPAMQQVAGDESDGMTWTMQTKCSSSYHDLKTTTDIATKNLYRVPGAPGLLGHESIESFEHLHNRCDDHLCDSHKSWFTGLYVVFGLLSIVVFGFLFWKIWFISRL